MKARAFALVCLRGLGMFVLFMSLASLDKVFLSVARLLEGDPIAAAFNMMPLLFDLIIGLVLLLGAESIVAETFSDISWKRSSMQETRDAVEETEPGSGGDLPLQVEDILATGFSVIGFLLLWEALPILLAMGIESLGNYPEPGGEGVLDLFEESPFWWGATTVVAEVIRLVMGVILISIPYRFANFPGRRARVGGEIPVGSA